MIITSKSELLYEPMMDKKNKGAECIEVYLPSEGLTKEVAEYLELVKRTKLDISAVHSPMIVGYEIDDLVNTENYKAIRKVFMLANEIGKMLNKEILVVMHMEGNLEIFKRYEMIGIIKNRVEEILSDFTNTNFAIENSMFFKFNNSTEKATHSRANYLYESVEIVEYLNKTLNRDIGTVFDTCHALSNIRLIKEMSDIEFLEKVSLWDYFNEFKDTVKIIHLANSIGLGYGIDVHAQPFKTTEDKLLLSYILGFIDKIEFNGYLTLEINEDSYVDSVNWLKTKNLVDNIIASKEIYS